MNIVIRSHAHGRVVRVAVASYFLLSTPLLCLAQSGGDAAIASQGNTTAFLNGNAARDSAKRAVAQAVIALSLRQAGLVAARASDTAQSESLASIAGQVRNPQGSVLAGVQITLTGSNGVHRTATADGNGAFTFVDLAPGIYQLKVNAPGVGQAAPVSVTLAAGEQGTAVVVATRIPEEKTTIQVIATPAQVAQAQVHQQEKQRVVGILPNYYTSYIWTAAPMTQKLKFNLALRSITDPVTFLVAAGVAGVEQGHNTFPGYGSGWEGYGKRYGATYADTVAGKMLGNAIFPAIFHQDPRYFYRGSGGIRSRIMYALISTVTCRGDNGRLEFNYSRVLGNFAAAGLSNVYRAPSDRRASLTLRNGLIITGGGAIVNLLREFVSRKLTSNIPAFANGKP